MPTQCIPIKAPGKQKRWWLFPRDRCSPAAPTGSYGFTFCLQTPVGLVAKCIHRGSSKLSKCDHLTQIQTNTSLWSHQHIVERLCVVVDWSECWWVTRTQVEIPALPFTRHVTLRKSLISSKAIPHVRRMKRMMQSIIFQCQSGLPNMYKFLKTLISSPSNCGFKPALNSNNTVSSTGKIQKLEHICSQNLFTQNHIFEKNLTNSIASCYPL